MVGKATQQQLNLLEEVTYFVWMFSIWLSEEKFITRKGIVKPACFYAPKTYSANQFFTHQIGVHSNVMEGIKPSV